MDSELQAKYDAIQKYQSLIEENGKEIQLKMKFQEKLFKEIYEQNQTKAETELSIEMVKSMYEEEISSLNNLTEEYKQEIETINNKILKMKNASKKDLSIDQNQEGKEKKQNSQEHLDESLLDQNSKETSNLSDKKNNEISEELTVLPKYQIKKIQNNYSLTTSEINEEKQDILKILNDLQQQIEDNREETKKLLEMKDKKFENYKNYSLKQLEDQKKELEDHKNQLEDHNKKLEDHNKKFQDLQKEYDDFKKNSKKQEQDSNQLFESYKIEKETEIEQLKNNVELMEYDLDYLNQIQALRLRSQLVSIIYDNIAKQYTYQNFQEFYQDKTAFELKVEKTLNQAMVEKAIELGFTEEQWEVLVEFKNQGNKIFDPKPFEIILNEKIITQELDSDRMGDKLIYQKAFKVFMNIITRE